jgi:indole-3-glycerol phosphate synthase
MTSILDRIAAQKQHEVTEAKRLKPLQHLSEMPLLPIRNFIEPIRKTNPAIIAEIKKASPSKGILCEHFDVATIANMYATHGACCLSVLTDVHFFQGDPSYIAVAKAHCNLPVLRKDFIIDPYQIHESRTLGADCILLIVALLSDQQLLDYCQLAQELGMSVLVESHTLEELERALPLPTPLMGINNRSLHSFQTNLQCTIDLKKHVPADKIVVSESGIESHEDIYLMQRHGIYTFLIGECLMRAPDMGAMLTQLID